MKTAIATFFFMFGSQVVHAKAIKVKVTNLALSPECHKFIDGIKNCEPGSCTIQATENGDPTKRTQKIIKKEGNLCHFEASGEAPNGNMRVVSCKFNPLQRNQLHLAMKEYKDVKELEFIKSDCFPWAKKCLYRFGNQELINVYGLGVLNGQCKVKEDKKAQ